MVRLYLYMRKPFKYALAITGLLFVCSTIALADPFNGGTSTTPQPFSVTCDPYTAPFVDGVAYMPTSGNAGFCNFTVPQVGAYKFVGIYKGVPGNSVAVQRGFVISDPVSVLTDTGYNFSGAQVGDTYYAAAFSSNNFNEALAADA